MYLTTDPTIRSMYKRILPGGDGRQAVRAQDGLCASANIHHLHPMATMIIIKGKIPDPALSYNAGGVKKRWEVVLKNGF